MNKVFLALVVPLVFAAAGCSETKYVDPPPNQPVTITRLPAPQVINTAPSATPAPQDNSASNSSETKTN